MTTEEFKQRLYNIYGDKFEVISEYINNCTKIKIKCNVCGNIFEKTPVKMTGVAHEGCYICSGKNKYKTTDSFKKEVEEKYPDTYEILGEYEKARKPLKVRRKKCNHVYLISPDNLLRGKGCPKCTIRQSSYMDLTEKYFQDKKIIFEKEKRFDDCKHIRTLPFDYFLKDYNCCVEVDGEFHFDEYYNGGTGWAKNKEEIHIRDEIKTNYCKNNNILLIRLPYYYFKTAKYIEVLNDKLQANTEITK